MSFTRALSSSYSHPEREFRTLGSTQGDMFVAGTLGVMIEVEHLAEQQARRNTSRETTVIDLRQHEVAPKVGQTAIEALPNPED